MQALLEIKKGERPYKGGVSEWLRDDDGALVFKVISKKRLDGQIEFVCYTQRSDGIKRIIQHISFSEPDFWGVMDALHSSMKEFFPQFKLDVQNIDLNNPEGFRAVKNNNINILKLRIISWFEIKFNSLKTRIRKK